MANDLRLSKPVLGDPDTVEGYRMVSFDLAWENSWRTSNLNAYDPHEIGNWDAAWVFIKYRVNDGPWQHAGLHETGHSTGTGTPAILEIGLVDEKSTFNAETNPVAGVFIYRSEEGSGPFNLETVALRWNYRDDGVDDDAVVSIGIFAVEMVYIPEWPFYLGSGGSEQGGFRAGGTENKPFRVRNTWDRGMDDELRSLWGVSESGDDAIGPVGELNPDYPTGLDGFYIMKYEVSQQQYVDFLNTLSYSQQDARITGSPDALTGTHVQSDPSKRHRNGIRIKKSGIAPGVTETGTPARYITDHPYLAMLHLSWIDAAAYADWAGLRPMTELEYEKAARGPADPVADEYAWGTDQVSSQAYELEHDGQSSEGITGGYATDDTTGNALYSQTVGSINGPVRVGIFAAHDAGTGRLTAGASYWGVMELSGNVSEIVVTAGNEAGRAFTGRHGNGLLSSDGLATVDGWPGGDQDGVSMATGSGLRGGSWFDDEELLKVSSRKKAVNQGGERDSWSGFRAARSLPAGFDAPQEAPGFPYGSVTDIDDNEYKTIEIGGQIWMAENLRTTHYRDGTAITTGLSNVEWSETDADSLGALSIYPHTEIDGIGNEADVALAYGSLYNWYAVTDSLGLCPEGWSVPEEEDWDVLLDYIVSQGYVNESGHPSGAGNTFKSPRQANSPLGALWATDEHPRWNSDNTHFGSDEIGFSGFPAGYRTNDGAFENAGSFGRWWSRSEDDATNAYIRELRSDRGNLAAIALNKKFGASVRCLRVDPASLTTRPVRQQTDTTAVTGGEITDDGGARIIARGVVWSREEEPSLTENEGQTVDGSGMGMFESTITGLESDTIYYVRAYAVHGGGVSYGDQTELRTWDISYQNITDVDGNMYRIIQIGNQWWMADNLQVTHYRDSTEIASGLSNDQWELTETGATDLYPHTNIDGLDSPQEVAEAYGRLYNWHAVNDARGICPSGWRVPTQGDWVQLADFINGNGNTLKSRRQVDSPLGTPWSADEHPRWNSHSTQHGTDEYGFSALPGGWRGTDGTFTAVGSTGRWWSRTESSEAQARRRLLSHSSNSVFSSSDDKRFGYSIRCIRVDEAEVHTLEATDITTTTARSGGDIVYEGISSITQRGVVWSTGENPTIENHVGMTQEGPGEGTGVGTFESDLTDLDHSTTYYLRAYATNDAGTVYGDQIVLTTLDDFVYGSITDIDDNEYQTVEIGDQEWMAENLRVTRYRDGTDIPSGLTNVQWEEATSGATALYPHPNIDGLGSAEEVAEAYGRLYNWHAVNDTRGLCPLGWRVPTEDDWVQLTDYLGSTETGNRLKSRLQRNSPFGAPWSNDEHPRWDSHSHNGTNEVGFSALPGGQRSTNGSFTTVGSYGNWWSRTESNETNAIQRHLRSDRNGVLSSTEDKRLGYSIRCIRVDEAEVRTLDVTDITTTTARSGGNIVFEGFSAITQRGVVWSTEEEPTIENHVGMTQEGPGEGTGIGTFESELTDLEPSVSYYLRAYATNDAGTYYGEQRIFFTRSADWARDTETEVVDVTNPATGRVWMDRNLGANRAAESSTDELAYGDLYQWGREADGHQERTSPTTEILSSTNHPGHENFILTSESPEDWRSPQNDNMWVGVDGCNNPCPAGYRLPTEAEWDLERASWSSNNASGAYDSPLKLPMAGFRSSSSGSLFSVGSGGYYWSSTVSGSYARRLFFSSSSARMGSNGRAFGLSVRCLKDE